MGYKAINYLFLLLIIGNNARKLLSEPTSPLCLLHRCYIEFTWILLSGNGFDTIMSYSCQQMRKKNM